MRARPVAGIPTMRARPVAGIPTMRARPVAGIPTMRGAASHGVALAHDVASLCLSARSWRDAALGLRTARPRCGVLRHRCGPVFYPTPVADPSVDSA
ncbi:hypothetical protein [Georgenia sp. AZ-5]|uniref:hypothetical protein n=1 Tax=Georgenia sp. AZ-5 TaxID=3367526 RepID=UPI003753FAEC